MLVELWALKIEGNIFISDGGQRGCMYAFFTHTKAIFGCSLWPFKPLPMNSHDCVL